MNKMMSLGNQSRRNNHTGGASAWDFNYGVKIGGRREQEAD